MAKNYTSVFLGDGNSSVYQATEGDNSAADDAEAVGFQISGTWNGCTAQLQVCVDTTASPLVFSNVPAAAFTQDVADVWNIPSGCYFRLNVSGSGSPLPALTFSLRGDINLIA